MSLRTMRSAMSKAACFKLALARDSLRRLEVCKVIWVAVTDRCL